MYVNVAKGYHDCKHTTHRHDEFWAGLWHWVYHIGSSNRQGIGVSTINKMVLNRDFTGKRGQWNVSRNVVYAGQSSESDIL